MGREDVAERTEEGGGDGTGQPSDAPEPHPWPFTPPGNAGIVQRQWQSPPGPGSQTGAVETDNPGDPKERWKEEKQDGVELSNPAHGALFR